jgi:hypothetical protein
MSGHECATRCCCESIVQCRAIALVQGREFSHAADRVVESERKAKEEDSYTLSPRALAAIEATLSFEILRRRVWPILADIQTVLSSKDTIYDSSIGL